MMMNLPVILVLRVPVNTYQKVTVTVMVIMIVVLDVVNLVLIAKQTKPKSQKKTYTSFYLDALQLVERNNVPNVPFDDLDDGEELFPEKTPVKKTTIDKEVLRKEKK